MDAQEPSLRPISVGRWVMVSTILASSMAFIDGSALNVALPALQAGLHASGGELLWVVNAYLLVLAALIIVGGSLGDRLGRAKVFMVGIALFTLGSAACGASPTIGFLIGARLVQGIGGALMIPGSLSIISSHFGPGERGRAIGTWSAVTTIVFLVGPVLGGLLSNFGLWRGVFFINVPLGILALGAVYLKVPDSRDETASGGLDYAGAALVIAGLAGLTYGFISAPDLGFGNPQVYGPLIAAALALTGSVVVEARSAHPMVQLGFFRSRTFAGANLLTLFLYGALSVGTFFLSLNLVQAQGYSLAIAGLVSLPFALLLAGMSRWSGGLADRYGPRLLLVAGPALVGVGFLVMGLVGLTRGPSDYWATYFPGVVLLGLGMGLTVAPLTTTVMSALPTEHSGSASGINNAVSRTAGVLAIAVVGALALFTFARQLDSRAASLNLPAQARTELRAESSRLGEAAVPPQVTGSGVAATQMAIKLSMVSAFRAVMFVCTGLAWLSALMAGVWLGGRP